MDPAKRMLSSSHLSVRILVVGPTGVGKTSLLERICEGLPKGSWTLGCATHITVWSADGSKHYYIEFVDISGVRTYENSRQIFYRNINGLLLLFDVTNRRSYLNLREWIHELRNSNANHPVEEKFSNKEKNRLGDLPVLIIGNKVDLRKKHRNFQPKKDFDINDIAYMTSFRSLDEQSDYPILEQFYAKVIERRFGKI